MARAERENLKRKEQKDMGRKKRDILVSEGVEEIIGWMDEALWHAKELDGGKLVAATRMRKALQKARNLIGPARAAALAKRDALRREKRSKGNRVKRQ